MSEDHDPIDLDGVLEIIHRHDWAQEHEHMVARENDGLDNCPAGIGLVPGDGRILHACSSVGTQALVYYHFTEPRRLVGLIPYSSKQLRTQWPADPELIPEYVRRFFENDHDWLVDHTEPPSLPPQEPPAEA